MARRVWKYVLPGGEEFELRLPRGAQILRLGLQHGRKVLWESHDSQFDHTGRDRRHFILAGTGFLYSDSYNKYIGTVLTEGGDYAWHLFERTTV